MSVLVVLKRFEVWLLLAVTTLVLWVALTPPAPAPSPALVPTGEVAQTMPGPVEGEPRPPAAEEIPPLVIREVRVQPTERGNIVETVLAGRSPSGSAIVLDESGVRATTATGQPVPRFFEPFQEIAQLEGEAESVAVLKWWLTAPTEELWLEVPGLRLRAEIKPSSP